MTHPEIENYNKLVEDGILKNDVKEIQELEKENIELKQALRWFCNRVDIGEVRSKRTYEYFTKLLNKYER